MYPNSLKTRSAFKSPASVTKNPITNRVSGLSSGGSRNVEELKAELEQLKAKEKEIDEKLGEYDGPPPETVLSDFIKHLHEYNDLKDAAQKLIGVVAVMEGVSIREVSKRYGAPDE